MKSKQNNLKRNSKLSRTHIKTKKRTKNIVRQQGGKIKIRASNEFSDIDAYTNIVYNELKKNNITWNQILCMRIYSNIMIIVTYSNIYLFDYLLKPGSINIVYRDTKQIKRGELFSSIKISGKTSIIIFYVSGKFEIYKIDDIYKNLVKILNVSDIFKLQNTELLSINQLTRDTHTLSVSLNPYNIEVFDTFNTNFPKINTEDLYYENIMFRSATKYLVQLVKDTNNRYALIFNNLKKLEIGQHREHVYDIISDFTNKVFDFKLYYHTDSILYIILLVDKGDNEEVGYKTPGLVKLAYNILDKENTVALSPFTITDEASHIPMPKNAKIMDFNSKIFSLLIDNKLYIIDLPIVRLNYLSWKIYELPVSKTNMVNMLNIVPSGIEYQDTFLITLLNNSNSNNIFLENAIHQPDLCIKTEIKQLESYF